MEIILINEARLKIMLEKEDLCQFEISADRLDYSNTETKRMFWDLLNRAKHETGFDTDGQRVLVQLYPSKDGGCEMFVTKIGLLGSDEYNESDSEDSDIAVVHTRRHKRTSTQKKHPRTFSFESTEWLIRVCRRLLDIGYSGESSAYMGDDGRSYLVISDIDVGGAISLDEYSFITEYGRSENSEILGCYIGEHGKTLCETNAVSVLGAL